LLQHQIYTISSWSIVMIAINTWCTEATETQKWSGKLRACAGMCVCVRTYVYLCACTCARMYVCVCVCAHACTHTYMRGCVHVVCLVSHTGTRKQSPFTCQLLTKICSLAWPLNSLSEWFVITCSWFAMHKIYKIKIL